MWEEAGRGPLRPVQHHHTGRKKQTCIADREAGELPGGPVRVPAPRYERPQQSLALQVPVEEGAVPAHVAQEVADARPDPRMRMHQQLAQVRAHARPLDGLVVLLTQPRQLADDQQHRCEQRRGVPLRQQPA